MSSAVPTFPSGPASKSSGVIGDLSGPGSTMKPESEVFVSGVTLTVLKLKLSLLPAVPVPFASSAPLPSCAMIVEPSTTTCTCAEFGNCCVKKSHA
jgi:hypothetical protein